MESGSEIAGRYRLERLLGRGGFAEVWEATDLLRDRPVAVKFLHRQVSEADSVVVAKFRQEAKIAARLEHPGITRVDDFGLHEGQWFLAMEFLHGRTLAAELADHPEGLPVERVVALGVQLADALAAAHEMGVVHRDLKPANLMVVGDDRLKVCDFGIARMADASLAQTFSGQVGTPVYMAPEQWLGEPVDHRTDLYAMGCVLFALLTGRPPFTGDRIEELMGRHLHAERPRVRAHRPEAPAPLDALIVDLLARKPEERPARTADVLARLRRIQQSLTASDTASPAGGAPTEHTLPVPAPSSTLLLPDAGAQSPPPPPVSGDSSTTKTRSLGAADRISRRSLLITAVALPVAAVPLVRIIENIRDDSRFTLKGHRDAVYFVSFSPDGAALATASGDRTAKVWNVGNGDLIATLTGHEGDVYWAGFSRDGTTVVTAGADGTVRLWNARTGAPITTLTGHEGDVYWVEFSPDGTTFATAGKDGKTKIRDAGNGHLITTLLGHQDEVYEVSFSADGTTIATASKDNTAKLWNAKTGAPISSLSHGHEVYSARFN